MNLDLTTATTITVDRKDLPDFVAWDGCHKIYALATQEEVAEAKAIGYEILITGQLPLLWEKACFLRFIHNWSLADDIVPQGRECESLVFTGFGDLDRTFVGDEA